MKVPLSFLKEYLNFNCATSEIASALTLAGIEVDEIKSIGSSFSGVVVGQILEVAPHPSADRLRIAKVSDGKEVFQIVCGASNCRAGLKTAFAKIGAQLTDEEGKSFKIKKGKLRDVESYGMLCGSDELQLGNGEGIILKAAVGARGEVQPPTAVFGIMELPEELPLGEDLAKLYSDEILELSLTPNLGHCMSILGIARELSAHLNIPLCKKRNLPREGGESIQKLVAVDLQDKKQCLRYACRHVSSVKVGPSPDWLKKKVESCGVRSINNVVDIGNLVMLELGQPLHLFDYDHIQGGKLLITSHTPYKEMETLDGQVRAIPPDVLLICDGVKPLALAGVMGGKNCAITEKTENVLIEAAHFVPQSIRKSTNLLQLKSDSSSRFEKGVDPQLCPLALELAAYLLEQVAGGVVSKGVIDCQVHEFSRKKIACRTSRVNHMLGVALSTSEIVQILSRLQIEVVEESLHQIIVSVPTFRMDITSEIDLIEEVARLYGYNHIPKGESLHVSSSLSNASLYETEVAARVYLLQEGLCEFMTCDLISPSQSQMGLMHGMDQTSVIKVLYPHSLDQSELRTTLLPGLLQVVKYNLDHGNVDVAGFEVGRIHFKEKESYIEPSVAGVILTGHTTAYHWDPKPREFDFFDLKGIVENLCAYFKVNGIRFDISHFHQFHPGRQAGIFQGETLLGVLGEVHPTHVTQLGVSQRVFFAQINLNVLGELSPADWKVMPLVPFPGSQRDWTVTMSDLVTIDTLLKAIDEVPSPLLEKVLLLDLYKSAQIGEDRKNTTFRFFYRDKEKTLSLDAVEKEHARIIDAASIKLKLK